MSASDHHLGPPLVETWVRTWWPWLVLAAGAAIVVLGGMLFSVASTPVPQRDSTWTPVIGSP